MSKIRDTTLTWLDEHVWTFDALTQSIIIIAAFIIGALVNKVVSTHLITAVNKLKAPVRMKQVLHNLRRLVFPTVILILISIAGFSLQMSVTPAEGETVRAATNTNLIGAAKSLILAWIVVRLAVQFVSNNFMRNLFALTIWGVAALSILGILDETVSALNSVGVNIGEFRISALTVMKGLMALFFLLYAAIFVSSLAEKKIKQVSGLTLSSKVLISKILRVTLITVALLIGITSAGIDLSLLAVFSGAIGLGIGFGLQKGVSNLFSGMLLLLDKSIKPGDILELPGSDGISTFGWVQTMGARYTEIVTRDNKSYLIPNEDFITQRVVNWSHGDTLIRVDIKFGVHYNSDPHKVIAIAIEAARKPERVVDNPEPVCHMTEFADSSINFALRFWIKDAEKGITNMRGEIMLNLWDAFKENGIEIPYPQRVVHIEGSSNTTLIDKKKSA